MVNNKAQKIAGVRATLADEQHLQLQNHFEALNIISKYKDAQILSRNNSNSIFYGSTFLF